MSVENCYIQKSLLVLLMVLLVVVVVLLLVLVLLVLVLLLLSSNCLAWYSYIRSAVPCLVPSTLVCICGCVL